MKQETLGYYLISCVPNAPTAVGLWFFFPVVLRDFKHVLCYFTSHIDLNLVAMEQ